MFRATLINWDRETGRAAPEMPPSRLGALSSDEVLAMLEQFRAIDPIENAEADPEIHFEVRRQKHVVRTGQGRLYLYDPRNVLEPALVLSAAEVLAELDGSAAAARTRAPFGAPVEPSAEEVAVAPPPRPVSPLRPQYRLVLAGIACCLMGYQSYVHLGGGLGESIPAFQPLANARQVEVHREKLAGVYMTGSQSGHHGIALAADGTMKLFQLNPQGAPSLLQDTYRIGQVDGQLCVLGNQPGGVVRVVGETALVFCGETYQRIP